MTNLVVENDDANALVQMFGKEAASDIVKKVTATAAIPQEAPTIDRLIKDLGGYTCGGVISLFEAEKNPQVLLASDLTEWIDVEFEVALDSGATDNVCHSGDVPGYVMEQSVGSRAGQGFLVGNGARVPNDGQVHLNLETSDAAGNNVTSTFQIAKVSRPLMSVGRLCDNGMDVVFKKDKALVVDQAGAAVCVFERQEGGLYTSKFKLKRPKGSLPFVRPE